MEKESCFEEIEKKKIGRREFIKKTLSGLGALWLGSYARTIEAALGQSKESIFKEQDPEKIIDKLNYIVEKIGAFAYKQLGCSWGDIYDLNNRPEAKKRLIERLNQKPEIKESIEEPAIMESLKEIKLEPETVKEFLKTLPESWCKEVALITYLDRPAEEVVNEFTGEKDELVAHHQSKGKEALSEIYFFPGAKKKKPEAELLPFLIYECAHVNNWRNRVDLSPGQRISLLYEVIRRVESPDRFKYEMIEKISRKSKEEELTKKAVEYWAAICFYSIMRIKPTKEQSNTLPPTADIKLVYDYLKMTDPDFDILNMARKRLEVIKRAEAEREAKEKINT